MNEKALHEMQVDDNAIPPISLIEVGNGVVGIIFTAN